MPLMCRVLTLLLLWASASAPLRAECQLTKVGGIEPVFGRERLYLRGKVNGQKVLFIVDTASRTMLFQEAAEKLGVRITGNARRESYGLTGQSMIDSRAVVDTLEIGEWKSTTVALRAVGPIEISDVGGVPVIGLIGDDLLSNFDVEISIKDKLLALYQPQGCEGANMAHWSPDNYNVVDIIRYTEQNPRIRMQAKLDGKTIAAMIDTGAPYSLMSQDIAASHDVTSDSPGTEPAGLVMGMHGQPVQSWVGTFKSFELDQEKIAPAKIDFFAFGHQDFKGASRLGVNVIDVDMLLGFDFLRAHHVLISHSQQKFYFSYVGGRPFTTPKPQDPVSDPTK